MSSTQSEQNRTEPATPFKLEESRKKGIVPRSSELNALAGLAAGLVCTLAFAGWCVLRLFDLESRILAGAGTWQFTAGAVVARLSSIAGAGMFVLSPLLFLVVAAAIGINLLQNGPVFTLAPLRPDFERINPAAGLKRLFSARSLFEALKVVIKLTLLSLATYAVLRHAYVQLPSFYTRAPSSYPSAFIGVGTHLLFALLGVMTLAAVADLGFTRWEFARRMRMSRRELRDEVKRREGDPRIRAKRRALWREMRRRAASTQGVKDADVLITNPEHYAVALKYRRGKVPAPEVIAKGAGRAAQAMRDVAFRSRIPIVPNPRLARALFREVPLGEQIPEQHFEIVASILRWVYDRQRKRG
jgi:flagellar biosynthetic protein FlhB